MELATTSTRPLKAVAPVGLDDAYWQRLQTLSGKAPAYTPAVKYLPEGKEALAERLRMIGAAKSSIILATYTIQYGPEVIAMLDALIAKAKEHVAVCFKFDAEREYMLGASEDIERIGPKLRELEAAGGVVFAYGLRQQGRSVGCGDHMKGLIADGKQAIVGGRNFGVKHFNGTYGDYDVGVGGSAAPQYALELVQTAKRSLLFHGSLDEESTPAQAQRAITLLNRVSADAHAACRQALANEATALMQGRSPGTKLQIVVCDPAFSRRPVPAGEHPNTITEAFIETIDRAREEIILNCNYFNPGEETVAAICRAAERGVQVHIVTASKEGAGISIFPYLNAHAFYPRLRASGVHIWESQRYQHEKLLVVDRRVATVGSYNFEPAAEEKLKEQTTFSDDPIWVANIRAFLRHVIVDESKAFDPRADALTFWQKAFFPFWFLFHWLEERLAYALRAQL